MKKKNTITDEKLEKYLKTTKMALKEIKLVSPNKTHLDTIAKDFLDMAKRYYSDAEYFKDKNDFTTAFAAINYAHGWLDCGARMGLFDVKHNSKLFTVD